MLLARWPRGWRALFVCLGRSYVSGMSKGRTIQDAIDAGERLEAWCHSPRCGHHAYLDLIKLREKLGPDHGAMHDDLVYKLRCAKCGGRKIGLIVHPNYARYDQARMNGKNLYAKAKGS